jgi:hypothetical protein
VNLPHFVFWLSPEHPEFPAKRTLGNPKRGEYITGFSRSKHVLANSICKVTRGRRLVRGGPCNFFSQPILTPSGKQIIFQSRLTNFFDLSNIRVESWGAGKMFGASRCCRKKPFQFDGQPALGADLLFVCDFPTPSKNILRLSGRRARAVLRGGRALLILRCGSERRFLS